MTSLLIVYHSQSGASAELARALCAGAEPEVAEAVGEITLRVLRACDCGTRDLLEAGAVVLVAAENSGALSGGMKDLLDRVFYPLIDHRCVLPYALVISAGNDGRNASRQAQRILSGIPFREVMPALICRGEVRDEHRTQCRELGAALAAGLAMGIF